MVPHKILIVSNFFPPRVVGGAEIVAHRQACALRERGHRIWVLAGDLPTESAPPGSLSFEHFHGLPVYRLSIASLNPEANFYWPVAERRLLSIVRSHDIDTVHFHNTMGLGANLIPLAKRSGTKVVATLHDHWGFCYLQTRLRADKTVCVNFDDCAQCMETIVFSSNSTLPIRLRRDYVAWCLSKADRLIAPSSYMARTYEQAGFREPLHLSNGIDLSSLTGKVKTTAENGVVRFLCTAYLGEHKGISVLLEALRHVAGNEGLRNRWHLTIAGHGHLRPHVEEFIANNNLVTQVDLPGQLPRSEVLRLLEKTHALVVPSIWPENEPVSILEALASGTAVIASRLGGNTELIEDGVSGFLVTPGNALELSTAMRKYIVNPKLAAEHGAHNRELRSRFDESHTINRLEEILDKTEIAQAKDLIPLIVCGAGSPPAKIVGLLNGIHEFLDSESSARFIWSEWSDVNVWQDAELLWLWDEDIDQSLTLKAISHHVPVLAPASNWFKGLERQLGCGVFLYETYLEALAAIKVIMSRSELRLRLKAASRTAIEPAIALAHNRSFELLVGAT
jgi:glycosyltransferase involved in cell wall biosynthesis